MVFDAFLLGIYRNVNLHNSLIEDRWKDFSNKLKGNFDILMHRTLIALLN